MTTEPDEHSGSKLGIGNSKETLSKPAFVFERSAGNLLTKHNYPREDFDEFKKTPMRVDTKLMTHFPSRSEHNFVLQHSEGFKNRHNGDLFQHVFRILLKNQYLLQKEFEEERIRNDALRKQRISTFHSEKSKNSDIDIEYVPIETKEFVLDFNIDQYTVLDKLASLYEEKNKVRLTVPLEEKTYSSNPAQVAEEFGNENVIIEKTLTTINEKGLHNLNLSEMVAFKSIVNKRLRLFSNIQSEIHKEKERKTVSQSTQTNSSILTTAATQSEIISSSEKKLPLLSNASVKTEPIQIFDDNNGQTEVKLPRTDSNRALLDQNKRVVRRFRSQNSSGMANVSTSTAEHDPERGYQSILDNISNQLSKVDNLTALIQKAELQLSTDPEISKEILLDSSSPSTVRNKMIRQISTLSVDTQKFEDLVIQEQTMEYVDSVQASQKVSPKNIFEKAGQDPPRSRVSNEGYLSPKGVSDTGNMFSNFASNVILNTNTSQQKSSSGVNQNNEQLQQLQQLHQLQQIQQLHQIQKLQQLQRMPSNINRRSTVSTRPELLIQLPENNKDDQCLTDRNEPKYVQIEDEEMPVRRSTSIKRGKNPNIGARADIISSSIAVGECRPSKFRLRPELDNDNTQYTKATPHNRPSLNEPVKTRNLLKQISHLSKDADNDPNDMSNPDPAFDFQAIRARKTISGPAEKLKMQDANSIAPLSPQKVIKARRSILNEDIMRRFLPENVTHTFSKNFKKTFDIVDTGGDISDVTFHNEQTSFRRRHKRRVSEESSDSQASSPREPRERNISQWSKEASKNRVQRPSKFTSVDQIKKSQKSQKDGEDDPILKDLDLDQQEYSSNTQTEASPKIRDIKSGGSLMKIDQNGDLHEDIEREMQSPILFRDIEILNKGIEIVNKDKVDTKSRKEKQIDNFDKEVLKVKALSNNSLYKWRFLRFREMKKKISRNFSIDIIEGSDYPEANLKVTIEHVERGLLEKRRHTMFARRYINWKHARSRQRSQESIKVHTSEKNTLLRSMTPLRKRTPTRELNQMTLPLNNTKPVQEDSKRPQQHFPEKQINTTISEMKAADSKPKQKLLDDLGAPLTKKIEASSKPEEKKGNTNINLNSSKSSSSNNINCSSPATSMNMLSKRATSREKSKPETQPEKQQSEIRATSRTPQELLLKKQPETLNVNETDVQARTSGLLTIKPMQTDKRQTPEVDIVQKTVVVQKDTTQQKDATQERHPSSRQSQVKETTGGTVNELVSSKKSLEKLDSLPEQPKSISSTRLKETSRQKSPRKKEVGETPKSIISDDTSPQRKTVSIVSQNEVPSISELSSTPASTVKKRQLTKAHTVKLKPNQNGSIKKPQQLQLTKAASAKVLKGKPLLEESKKSEKELKSGETEETLDDGSEQKETIKEENEEGGDTPKGQQLMQQFIKRLVGKEGENLTEEEVTKVLMNDPMKVVTELMHNEAIDNETKLDLYLLGNRQEQLKEHIRLLEANIEENLMAEGDCNEQLKNFFDFRVKESKGNKNELRFSQNLVLPGDQASRLYLGFQSDEDDDDDDDVYSDEEDPEKAEERKLLLQQRRNAYRGHLARGDFRTAHGSHFLKELEAENNRREYFKAQKWILGKMKEHNISDKGVIQDIIKDPKEPKYKSFLFDPNRSVKKKKTISTEEKGSLDADCIKTRKLAESFRKQLIELQQSDPEQFNTLMERFGLIQSEISNQIHELEREKEII